jgi:BCD family chlorophyll transporter-like MFS transporter
MAMVLLLGTLNRVMIVELKVPTTLVAIMVALPILFAPFRALIGFHSDRHRSELGWRRVPYIWRGTMAQFGGFAIMPFALLVLAGAGQAAHAPIWVGYVAAGAAFLLVGAGLHTVQTAGLALATDLTAEHSKPRMVGLMYVTLLLGMAISAVAFGYLLTDYSHGRLIQVIQGAAVTTLVLNTVALWKQEPRNRARAMQSLDQEASFFDSMKRLAPTTPQRLWLLTIFTGTLAFTMEDVLLEPYGGEVLGLSVSATTYLTATLALGSLLGFWWASERLGRQACPYRLTQLGAWVGVPSFIVVMLAAPLQSHLLFSVAVFGIGLGAGLFGHGTLTATILSAPNGQSGLALGLWGALQATAAGLGMASGGILKDLAGHVLSPGPSYAVVYALELVLLGLTLKLLRTTPLNTQGQSRGH